MAWDPPSDAELAVGKPGKPSLARRIRDLPAALAQRAAGAPWLNGVGATETLRGFGPILPGGERALAGTWIVPDGVYTVEVTIIGGGGAGGPGDTDQPGGGGGGGATFVRVLPVEPGQIYGVVIGAGGWRGKVSPYVDTSLDNWQTGDGARSTFGTLIVAGGKRGEHGSAGGAGGAGGDLLEGGPSEFIAGGDGTPGVGFAAAGAWRSGRGGGSSLGGGAPGRSSLGAGHPAGWIVAGAGLVGVPGAGGGGGNAEDGLTEPEGGRGANGAVILRY